jgi:hypothetical protein
LLLDRYKAARLNAKTPEEQIKMIVRAGYSTNTPDKYYSGLKGIVEATQDYVGFGRIV